MLYEALCRQARAISSRSLAQPLSPEVWQATLAHRRRQWLEMLGLWPLPERTPLKAVVTGILERGDYVVEKLHFQSLPGAYVIGNLYRPAKITEPLPAVLYLCGHTKGKVHPPYQAQPRWFGQHGYVALVLDPIQLGESQGVHHGTYHQGRWDWPSRGYTPAGTEVWNAMRALDYLQTREDVDGERLGVTGLSGGGAISWFLGAADERVKVVVPVCQTGTIEHLITDRATDGHCDCAFWLNIYQWCTPDIGALIAPRALLVAAGTEDVLWRPYAFRDALHRIRQQYAVLGAPENVALVEDLVPHGYSPLLRRAIFCWFNRHLKGDESPVEDDVTEEAEPEENLLVFGGQRPEKDEMRRVDEILPQLAPRPEVTDEAQWGEIQKERLAQLCASTFRCIPYLPAPRLVEWRDDGTEGKRFGTYVFDTEDGLRLRMRMALPANGQAPRRIVAYALPEEARTGFAGGAGTRPAVSEAVATACVEVRNTGATSTGPGYLWSLRRGYMIVGQTLPERQIFDLLQALALLRQEFPGTPLALYGEGRTAVLAIYAALLDELVEEIFLVDPPQTHLVPDTPELLNVLRVGDLPENLALLYPRRITFIGRIPEAYEWTQKLYQQLGQGENFRLQADLLD